MVAFVWLQFFVFQNIVTEIHNHGMKAKLKPALECREISLRRPDGRHAVPSVQVFLENGSGAFPQILNGLILGIAFRHQVDRGLSLYIFEREVRVRRIHLMKPIQEWLCRFNNDR